MDTVTLTVGALLALSVALASVAGSYAVTKYRCERVEGRNDALEKRCERLERELADFRLEAARRFVTDEMLVQVEQRVVEAIKQLTGRLDRVLEIRSRPRSGAGE